MKKKTLKGYKVFNSDWTCNGFKYKIGEEYKMDDDIAVCKRGFHFCKKLVDCFEFYAFDPKNKVAEIEALGIVKNKKDDIKSVTNHIKIVKELSWLEVCDLVNTGTGNTGKKNSGNRNSGNRNSGYCNSGNRNSGDYNSGYCNSGNRNSGNYNSGNRNSGNYNSSNYNSGNYNSGYYNSSNYNSGNYNSGYCNSGNYNSGNYNSGDYNSGYCNSGYYNSGNYNSGNYNSGNRNSGNYNSGYCNSGNRNSGDYNSGYCNSGNRNSGIFINTNLPVFSFNKKTKLTMNEFKEKYKTAMDAIIFGEFPLIKWISKENMTDEEKEKYPYYETTGGYLRANTYKQAWAEAWKLYSEKERQAIQKLPNFNKDIFKDITGIDLQVKKENVEKD